MISRIYIDNYKCFTNFEYQPGALQLLIGRNGTGKTAVFDILVALEEFLLDGSSSLSTFPASTATAWDERPEQTFELALKDRGGEYFYQLVIEQDRAARKNRIRVETLRFDGRLLYQFDGREVHLFRDDGAAGPIFPFDESRSAFSTIPARKDHTLLGGFREILGRILVLSPDPPRMTSESGQEWSRPDRCLHQLASWIRHLHLESLEFSHRLAESLRENVLEGLQEFRLLDRGEGARALTFKFGPPKPESGRRFSYYSLGFDELSTGQRALVALYTMLHAAIGSGQTLCIDEPDNYIALREIQPWLVELSDRVGDTGGQCLLISHNPELIDYLAADCGVSFFRERGGPVRVRPFEWPEDETLRPAEVVARGWENP